MGGQETKKGKKHMSVGVLAHVDAGKTTLSEGILYLSGCIRRLGRVDYGDAFLDTYDLERARGITIFSKQAIFPLGDWEVTLLDTPGHVDFSAEMERTLQVLDYAILVINGADGVQGHTLTLWRLLALYQIPVFLFVNKMDQVGTDSQALLAELKKRLNEGCIDFSENRDQEEWAESLAVSEEGLLETYLESGQVEPQEIRRLIGERKVFPCYFGSALKLTGVEAFLRGLEEYMVTPVYPEEFGAKVYKIARDSQGTRLTYMKITGGSLKVKELLTNKKNHDTSRKAEEIWEEKADQLRIYSGAKYETVTEVQAGSVCAVTGLTRTYPGQGLGAEAESDMPVLEPVLTYEIQLPQETDAATMLPKLRLLEEEEPELHIVWNEQLGEIHAQVMGEVQIEVLKSLVQERFQTAIEFGAGNIVYKETIEEPVEGVGHFEPLRHYAEVHLLLEPGERGSGLTFCTDCSEDELDRNWQRLILTHLEEKIHPGVLTGSPITDMVITLVGGRAHLKHTEGGDFRQATYRAVRQGLKQARSLLLEPVYEFRLELPTENLGRAMADIQKMYGTFQPPVTEGEFTILQGSAPVVTMRDYQREVAAYTRGRGRLFCSLKGYEPCHNEQEVIEAIGYDSERDLDNPTGSVFCAHGAGFVVSWDKVRDYMHVDTGLSFHEPAPQPVYVEEPARRTSRDFWQDEKELQEIFQRTYGSGREERTHGYGKRVIRSSNWESRPVSSYKKKETGEEYLLVDGYNIIFAWEDLNELAKADIGAARTKLMDILSNYQGYKKCTLILVFDAYKVEGHACEISRYHNIYVVYTQEAETADQYIEKTVHEMGRKYQVTVATSDGLEQVIILGQGGKLLSARELREEVRLVQEQIREECHKKRESSKRYLFDSMDQELADYMEEVRLGKKKL